MLSFFSKTSLQNGESMISFSTEEIFKTAQRGRQDENEIVSVSCVLPLWAGCFFYRKGTAMSDFEKIICDDAAIDRALTRISHEIIERNAEEGEICLFGIRRRGIPLATRIAENISNFSDIKVNVGELDITLYRDDLSQIDETPEITTSKVDFSIVGKTVVIVDDVIYTGRTARAAMDALCSLGRPARIQLAVLIDRGHRELPIRGDYVGKNVPTSREEIICVKLPEYDGCKMVTILKKQ